MPRYTVRVELVQNAKSKKEAGPDDYLKVREVLAGAGFLHTVTDSDGKIYELPPAEYRGSREESRPEVANMVRTLINEIWTPNRVLVTEGLLHWSGLDQIKPATTKK